MSCRCTHAGDHANLIQNDRCILNKTTIGMSITGSERHKVYAPVAEQVTIALELDGSFFEINVFAGSIGEFAGCYLSRHCASNCSEMCLPDGMLVLNSASGQLLFRGDSKGRQPEYCFFNVAT